MVVQRDVCIICIAARSVNHHLKVAVVIGSKYTFHMRDPEDSMCSKICFGVDYLIYAWSGPDDSREIYK